MKLIALLAALLPLAAAPPPKIAEKTAGMEKLAGFFTVYHDEAQGKIWLEIGRWNEEFIYVTSLPAGIGSNDIGLDRGQLGETRVARFERHGPKVLLVESNYGFRASSADAAERKAVKDSFAESVLWGFEVGAEEPGLALVDATAFFLRDAHNVARRLEMARQGTWRADASRSAIYKPMTRSFPRNTEVEAIVTLTGSGAGPWLREVSPSTEAVTVRERHSFIASPEPGYVPRAFDPRAGYFPLTFFDYSTPFSEPIAQRLIHRHRLEKDASGNVLKPIVYYVDRGTPEPIRTALVEGARWWSSAFEAAGFRDAFKVEVMPEGADPMDVRYNVIQWVHRSTRGWSYGSTVSDPRTGEILKGHVTLGSLRVRQDYLIARAFLSPFGAQAANPELDEMPIARLRQLSAHEVGHTLGLSHNYIASAQSDSSVMDYPHPKIGLDSGGAPTLANAYPSGIGDWDKVAITYGYGQVSTGAAGRDALNQVLAAAEKRGIYYLTDEDARPTGSAHPQVHLWDNGASAAAELSRMLKVRAAAMERFGADTLKPGEPWANLEDLLVPIYFSHRYQVEAAAKAVGGLRYRYALKGDGQPATEPVQPAEQKQALDALLATLEPSALAIPKRIASLIPPRPAGIDRTRELFRGRTSPVFDPVAAAETAADMTAAMILDPQRATRLANQQALDPGQLTLTQVLAALNTATWAKSIETGASGELRRAAGVAYLRRLLALAASGEASPSARGTALEAVASLEGWLKLHPSAYSRFALSQIDAFRKEPKSFTLPPAPVAPPGMPIGMACDWE